MNEEDLANIGRALLEAISVHADEGWRPADCPSEIVGDLRNQRDEARSAIKKEAVGYSKGFRDGLVMAASEMDAWACEMDSVSPEHARELREHAASLRGDFDGSFSQLEEDEITEEQVK